MKDVPFAYTTLTRFLIEEQRRAASTAGATGSFTALVNDVRLAVKRIAALTAKGALAAEPAGGDLPLIRIAEQLFVHTTEWGGQLAGLLGRGWPAPHAIPEEYPRGCYLLLFTPLDDTSSIDLNVPVGSLFSVLRCPERPCDPKPADFLQAGAAQVCAGYAVYGPSTMLVLTTGSGVNGFTLDREIGEFLLTHPDLRLPDETSDIVINAGSSLHWEPAIKRYVNECLAGRTGPRGRDFNMRWSAALVAETHRILMRGGVFMHPWDRRGIERPALLSLLHEANPIGLLIEQAGGRASSGLTPILEVLPESLHQRTSFVFGPRAEVERIERYHRDHNDFELDAPLFGTRGLFTHLA
jgi:fructose-1,6-bisphosphatase I/sedoheptulose-1,7-bisphosphatase